MGIDTSVDSDSSSDSLDHSDPAPSVQSFPLLVRAFQDDAFMEHPYSSSAFREGNRWMGGSVGCSVFEEHPRVRIEYESET